MICEAGERNKKRVVVLEHFAQIAACFSPDVVVSEQNAVLLHFTTLDIHVTTINANNAISAISIFSRHDASDSDY